MKTILRFAWIFLCLALTLVCRFWNVRDVFLQGQIYYIDGDCYSRMTRARMIVEHPGSIIHHHDFENWPQGVNSHTTAPLDYLIVGLKVVLDGAFRVLDANRRSLLHDQTLDLAGALISPLLGLAGAIFLIWWCERFRMPFGSVALLVYAVNPILVHGTLLGRPDHQSLLMTLFTVALGAELALAHGGAGAESSLSAASERRWGIVSGLAWSLSLWVSLYEPTILLAAVLALWLCFRPRALWSKARIPGAVVFVVVLLLSLLLEGWSVELPNPEIRAYFPNWSHTIGELEHLYPKMLFTWVGWGIFMTPVLLLLAWRQDRRALPLFILLAVVLMLSVWQVRWGYFVGVVFAWTVPWQLQALSRLVALPRSWALPGGIRALCHAVAMLGLCVAASWPVLKDWDLQLYPKDFAQDQKTMWRAEMVTLRRLAVEGIGGNKGPFLASWWISPEVAYWSRQPGVAGTSHESLPGIVDTAKFFLSTDAGTAGAILRKRSVRWVLAGDPTGEIKNSSTLLGVTPPPEPLATVLYDHPEDTPAFLGEWNGLSTIRRDGLRFYRLYTVIDDTLPP